MTSPDLGGLLRAVGSHPAGAAIGETFGPGAGLEEVVPIVHAHAGRDPSGHAAPALELRNRIQVLLVTTARALDDVSVAMGVDTSGRTGDDAFGLGATGMLLLDSYDLGFDPLSIGDAATDLLAWFAVALVRLTTPPAARLPPRHEAEAGEPPRPPSPLRDGQWIVGRYLGRGLYGVAYAGHRSWTDTGERALKIFYRPGGAADADRLERELARLMTIPVHLNLQAVHHSFRLDAEDAHWDGRWVTVSELGTGETVGDLARSGALSIDEARAAAIDAARGLKALHADGVDVVPHGDLHADNVFRIDGVWKLADFGVTASSAAGGGRSDPAADDIERFGAVLADTVAKAQVPDGEAARGLADALLAIAQRCRAEGRERPDAAALYERLRLTRPAHKPGLDELRGLRPELQLAAERGYRMQPSSRLDRDFDALVAVSDRDDWLMRSAATAAADGDDAFLAVIDGFVDRMARTAETLWQGPGPECRAFVRRLASEPGLVAEDAGAGAPAPPPAAAPAEAPAPAPEPRSLLDSIVVGEWVVPGAGSDWEALREFLAVSDERGHHASSIVVDGRGRPVTPPGYVDRMAAPAPDGRSLAFVRRLSADRLGQSPGSDWVRDHAFHMMFVGGSPFESDPSLYHHLFVATPADPPGGRMVPLSACSAPAWSHDGRSIALLDSVPNPAAETSAAQLLWLLDPAAGERRLLAAFPGADRFGELRLQWSGDDAWLLASDVAYGRNRLVEVATGLVVELPIVTPAIGWNPAAGPSALLGILPPRDAGPPSVVVVDLVTMATEELGVLSSPAARAATFVDLAVATDGTLALSTAPVAGALAEAERQQGPPIAVVVDLVGIGFDPVLPPSFRNGAQRSHVGPRWYTSREPATAATEVGEQLRERAAVPGAPVDADAAERIAGEWLEDAMAILAAWRRRAMPATTYADEFRRLVNAAGDAAPERAREFRSKALELAAGASQLAGAGEWLAAAGGGA